MSSFLPSEVGFFGAACETDKVNGCQCDPPIDFFSGYVTHPSKVTRPYASFLKNPCKYGNTFSASEALTGSNGKTSLIDNNGYELDNLPADFSSIPPVVNSWNGWDPLEEVIVGTYANGRLLAIDETYGISDTFEDAINRYGLPPYPLNGVVDDKMVQAAIRAQDNLAILLKNENIIVRRPEVIPFEKEIKTPLWDCDHTNCVSCPRDVLITLGNAIVETPVSQRCRYFEHLAYRNILNEYFHRDPHFLWYEGPKPTMTNVMIRPNFDWKKGSTHQEICATGDCLLTEHEAAADAASILRMGKDLFVLRDVRTNLSFVTWLQRMFKDQFRIHPIFVPEDPLPWHFDATLLCIRQPEDGRPGIILNNSGHILDDCYKKLFEPDWKILMAPQPNHASSPEYCNHSTWLCMNTLMTDPKTMVVERTETKFINFYETYGIRVLQVDFRDAYFTGGAIHCDTADIRRRGGQKDYLPTLTRKIEKVVKKQQEKQSSYLQK